MSENDTFTVDPERNGFCPGLVESMNTIWGIAPIAPLHLGYDNFIVLQKKVMATANSHSILLADNHAMMSHGLTYSEISKRSTYYEVYLRHCCGLNANYVRGSDFQTKHEYVERLYRIISRLRFSKIKRTLSKVSKQDGVDSAYASSLLYSVMQCLDCCYLNIDVVISSPDQKKIYRLIDDFPDEFDQSRVFSKPRRFGYFPLGYDIAGKPLNQSKSATRISIHETQETLSAKIKQMYAPPHDQPLAEGRVNALIEHFRNSVFPWVSTPILIRLDNNSSVASFDTFQEFQTSYLTGRIEPQRCKDALFTYLWERLSSIQAAMGSGICDWISFDLIAGRQK
ncbi:hypothetical protein CHL67_08375 [Prosthecochloris sp. GSB1]|uniref:hypothetical protein n=1 Tax=Prosthecochloris sp. GSB1 TaxID=281093 RepID=UPI000B8CA5DD|nr:hypothetical protein [Prosthecochloris sp. GSB1]ASQ90931.1 hypothetical protein CHL67_08375 [Prosthecochloris sp. GSB1]